MPLLKTLKFIVSHPISSKNKYKSLTRFFLWQFRCLFTDKPKLYRFCEKSKLLMRKGLSGATGNLYCGLQDFEEMGFLLHFLRPKDLFVDVGANIGSYTVLASSEVGTCTIAVEPVPSTFRILKENIKSNSIEKKVTALNIAFAGKAGTLNITPDLGTCNYIVNDDNHSNISIFANTFDDVVKIDCNTLVKIDVEGYETEVLNGMSQSLKSKKLKAIIIELMGSGERYGYDESKIHEKLISLGFVPYAYKPFERNLIKLNSYADGNTIYIKDFNFVLDRVMSSRTIKILDVRL